MNGVSNAYTVSITSAIDLVTGDYLTFTSSTGILQVLVTNVCPSATCTSPQSYSVLLSGRMKNPASVITISGNFVVESLSSSNYIVS